MDVGLWLSALRSFPAASLLDVAWGVLQWPLLTLWQQGALQQINCATSYCLAGDFAIEATVLVSALLLIAHPSWPSAGAVPVALCSNESVSIGNKDSELNRL